MVDERAWAAITVFAMGVAAILNLLGGLPTGVVLIVGFLAAVLLPGIGVLVPGERGAQEPSGISASSSTTSSSPRRSASMNSRGRVAAVRSERMPTVRSETKSLRRQTRSAG